MNCFKCGKETEGEDWSYCLDCWNYPKILTEEDRKRILANAPLKALPGSEEGD